MKIKDFFIRHKIIIAILVFAAILRFWNLGGIPPSLNQDEASLGYNAYSILKTGKDEYGKILPVIFKSFGDYKPGLYVYLDIPFISVLGLNEVATRLPSAVAGLFTVWLVYLIVKKLFGSFSIGGWKLESISAFVTALNPYLIYFSRAAWEANVSLTLTLAGIYFFIKALENNKYLIISALAFSLTLITYQGAKLSTSIVLILLVVCYWKEFWKIDKGSLITSAILGVFISLPIVMSLFNGQATRLSVYSIFSYKRPVEEIGKFLVQGGEKIGDFNYLLFHSESLNYFRAILGRWFNNFSGKFLFFTGDWANPISTSVYQGVLLLGDLLFLPLGFYFLFKSKSVSRRVLAFLICWLVFSPLPSAFARDEVNAVRSLNMAIPLVIIISFGVYGFLDTARQLRFWYLIIPPILILYILGVVYFVDSYFVHVPAHNSFFWRYGYKQAIAAVDKYAGANDRIVFEQSFNQPYIYFLYYRKINPKEYQSASELIDGLTRGDVGFVTSLGNVEFSWIDWSLLKNTPGTIVVTSPVSLPPDYKKDADLLEEVKYLNKRDTAFLVVRVK